MLIRPSEVMMMFDDYVLVEPNGDMVYSEDIEWMIQDERDEELLKEWFE